MALVQDEADALVTVKVINKKYDIIAHGLSHYCLTEQVTLQLLRIVIARLL